MLNSRLNAAENSELENRFKELKRKNKAMGNLIGHCLCLGTKRTDFDEMICIQEIY